MIVLQKKNNAGMASVMLVVTVIVLVALFVMALYIFVIKNSSTGLRSTPDTTNSSTGLETLREDESTPKEINNDVIEELDSMVLEVESDTTLNVDFSDLTQ